MNKQIVILGGMGPQASLELHRKVLARATQLGAKNGSDFPSILHMSLPIEDFISDRAATSRALGVMAEAAGRLYLWRRLPIRHSLQHCPSAGR